MSKGCLADTINRVIGRLPAPVAAPVDAPRQLEDLSYNQRQRCYSGDVILKAMSEWMADQ